MIVTKRKIETEQDRFGGFASSMNRDIYASSIVESPRYETDLDQNREVETIGEQLFEVEKEYKIKNPVMVDDEIQPIKTFMPTLQKKSVTKQISDEKIHVKLNVRGKIMLAVYSSIVLLLSVFCIYNAFVIGNMNQIVTQKESAYVQEQTEINALEQNLNNMTAETTIKARLDKNFRSATEGDKIYVNAGEKTAIPTYEEPSNFFDKLCVFFSELFN